MESCNRRSVLAGLTGAAAIAIAGCLGDDDGDDLETPPAEATPTIPYVESLAAPSIGPDEVPSIEVFTDFSCPGCAWFKAEVYPLLRDGLVADGEARYEHVDWPFIDDWSVAVANGGRAVQDHGDDDAFFEYATDIFDHQGDYSLDAIESVADEAAGLGDIAREAAEFGSYDAVIDDDFAFGEDLGVGGTPSVAVDQTLVPIDVQAPPSDAVASIESAVDDAA